MKKMIFKKCFLFSVLMLMGFVFSSCSHIFDSNIAEIKTPGLCTVYGKIDGSATGAFPSAKTVLPEIDSAQTVYYRIVAEEVLEAGSTQTSRTYSSHYVSTESSFEIGLPIGIWKLYAYGYKNYSVDKKKYSNLMLASQYGSEISITDITKPMVLGNTLSVHFATASEIKTIEGADSATGGISLEIDTSGTGIKKVSLSWDHSTALSKTYDCSGGSLTIEEDSIGTGEYRVGFYFYASTEEDAPPVYYFSELIHIYPNNITNTWKSEAEYVSGGKITVTETLVEKFAKTVFYVGGAGSSDTGSGSFFSPFASIEKAVEIIDATGNETTEYKIYLLDSLAAGTAVSSDSFVDISPSKPRKIKISSYGKNTSGSHNSYVISAGKLARVMSIGSNAEVTLENVQVTGGYLSGSGGGIKVAGTLHLKNGARVWGNNATYGGGIYNGGEVHLHDGCSVDNNTAYNGGGIYIAGSKTAYMYGGKIESNLATSGSGVCIVASATLDLQGGTFSNNDNTVAVISSGNLKLSGNIIVTDGDCLYVTTGKTVEITGAITSENLIPVSFGSYTTTEPVLTGALEVVSANYQKIALASTRYVLNSDGTLKKLSDARIGDILLADGTFVPAAQYSPDKGEAVGILFYKKGVLTGSTEAAYFNEHQGDSADSVLNEIDSLVIGLEYATAKWDTSSYFFYTFEDLKGTTAGGTISGIAGWEIVKSVAADSAGNPGANFPAYDYILNYRKTESKFNSDWYMPAVCELAIVYRNLDTLNASLEKAGKNQLAATYYWSCTNVSGTMETRYSIALNFDDGSTKSTGRADATCNVLPILALDSEGKVVKTSRVCEMSDCYSDSSVLQDVPGAGYTCYVSSEDDLKYLGTLVNSGNNLAKVTIKLKNDIILTEQWTPVGTQSNCFSGNFDGQDHKISGLNVGSGSPYAGFFGVVETNSTIKTVSIKNLTVEGSVKGTSSVGGIAGYVSGAGDDSKVKIDGCVSTVRVTATGDSAGGICGSIGNYVEILNCVNTGSAEGNSSVGGLAGSSAINFMITNCANFGTVLGTSEKIGGLVGGGSAFDSTCKIIASYNAGSVSGPYDEVGAIAGIDGSAGDYNGVYWASGALDKAFASGSDGSVGYLSALSADIFNNVLSNSFGALAFTSYKEWKYTYEFDGKSYPLFVDIPTDEETVEAANLIDHIKNIAAAGVAGTYAIKVDDIDSTLMKNDSEYPLKAALKDLNGTEIYVILDFSDSTTLTGIPANAFGANSDNGSTVIAKNLVGCKLPAGLGSIGQSAFNYTAIETIEIPAGTTISGSDFVGCVNLTKAVVYSEKTPCFSGCDNLSEVVLGENVKSVSNQGFSNCASLTEITFPESFSSIPINAFAGAGLKSATFLNAENWYADSTGPLNLSNAGTNATYLTETYANSKWTKK